MLRVFRTRLRQRHRTIRYPYGLPPALPLRFAGRPQIDASLCVPSACNLEPCVASCPVGALNAEPALTLDVGSCIFCRACERSCPNGAISFTSEFRMGAANREDLLVRPTLVESVPGTGAVRDDGGRRVASPATSVPKRFRRSFRLRQVSAGGCGACEAEANVLSTIAWDLSRFGVHFVASPRHADGLLITGPVTENMRLALEKTWSAVPSQKVVIAMGSCAISGGPFRGHVEAHDGVSSLFPIDLYIPGCPPHPLTVLEALLWFLGRVSR